MLMRSLGVLTHHTAPLRPFLDANGELSHSVSVALNSGEVEQRQATKEVSEDVNDGGSIFLGHMFLIMFMFSSAWFHERYW